MFVPRKPCEPKKSIVLFLIKGPTFTTAYDEQYSELGSDFRGNRVDYRMNPKNSPTSIFLTCYNGKYVDCMGSQVGVFTELVNFNRDSDIYGFWG